MRIGGILDLERNVLIVEHGQIPLEKFDPEYLSYNRHNLGFCTFEELLMQDVHGRELDFISETVTHKSYWLCR